MRYRKLDANGDYTSGTGADFYVNQPEAVAQAVLTKLQLWAGEWFLDSTEGTPYGTEVLGKLNSNSNPDAVIISRILDTPGVLQISDYASSRDPDTRQWSVTATIDTIYGLAYLAEVPL